MVRYPVAVLVNARPGYSDYNLGEQLRADLEARGAEVRMFDKKQSSLLSHVVGCHLVSFYTDMVWPLYKYARHARPKSVLHLQCIGPKVYPMQEYVAYLSTLAKPKMSGIPVRHVNVSPSTEHDFRQIARRWFAPSVAQGILERAVTIPYGIEDGFVVHEQPDLDSLIVPYNRWEPGQKNLPLHMRLSDQYRLLSEMRGRTVESVFLMNSDDYDKKRKHGDIPPEADVAYRFADQFYDRPTFKQEIGRHGLFLCTSVRESFGLYYLELLKAGVVGVFQSYPWIETLLPEYPFIGPEDELVPMLLWARENYAEARAMMQPALDAIDQRYSQQGYLDGLWAELEALDAMDDRDDGIPHGIDTEGADEDPVPSIAAE